MHRILFLPLSSILVLPCHAMPCHALVPAQGPQLEEALLLFINLVLTDMEELATTPVYFVEGVAIMDPPSFDTHQGVRHRLPLG